MHQMICQNCGNTQPYHQEGHDGEYKCHKCGGDYCGCEECNHLISLLEDQNLKGANAFLDGTLISWDCCDGWKIAV